MKALIQNAMFGCSFCLPLLVAETFGHKLQLRKICGTV